MGGWFVFHIKRLESMVLPWQKHSMCHSVSFSRFLSDSKFEEHCFNISGDILDSVFYRLSGTTYDVITLLICMIQKRVKISKTKRGIPKRKVLFFFTLKSLSNKHSVSGRKFYFRSKVAPQKTCFRGQWIKIGKK